MRWGRTHIGGELTVSKVVLRPGESGESLVRRFSRKVIKDGTLREVKRKRFFVSKSEKRRIAERKAIRRMRRRERKNKQAQ
jgi:small subunit ribosomal protein S21